MKKITIIVSILVLGILVLVILSICQTNKLEKELKSVKPLQVPSENKQVKQEPAKLIPANPADYGMTVIDDYNRPKTQEDWDRVLLNKITDAKSQLSSEQVNEMKKQIEEDPQKTQEKLKKIDELIVYCDDELKKNPSNQEIKDKRDRLMMLKSISKELIK